MTTFEWAVQNESSRASKKFPPFNSKHEGYAVLLEEVDELWGAIKNNEKDRRVWDELVQVAAMCNRFAQDLLGDREIQDQPSSGEMRLLVEHEGVRLNAGSNLHLADFTSPLVRAAILQRIEDTVKVLKK